MHDIVSLCVITGWCASLVASTVYLIWRQGGGQD